MTAPQQPPIVAGIDGSRAARAAAHWAADDAVRRGITLRLVHVLDHPASASYPAPVLLAQPVTDRMRAWARHLLEVTAAELTDAHPGLTVKIDTAEGTPWSVLVGESANAALTVVGSHGGGQLSEVVFGSVASRLASHAHGSVVIVRSPAPARGGRPGHGEVAPTGPDVGGPDPGGPDPGGPDAVSPAVSGPVVVGVDGSAEADGAISFAFGEAALRGSALVAVHAWNDKPLEHALVDHEIDLDTNTVHTEQHRQLLRHLSRWTRRHPAVEVVPVVLKGRPAAALLSYLAHDADAPAQLLVVGHRGRGGFARLLLGSTSTSLVVHADCPVVVVRHWPEDPDAAGA